MKKLILLNLILLITSTLLLAQWTPYSNNDGSLLTNSNGRHFQVFNPSDGSSVRLFLGGNFSHDQGLQLGRSDIPHRITLQTDQTIFSNNNRHVHLEIPTDVNSNVKLFLGGNYSALYGLQLGRLDNPHRITLMTHETVFSNNDKHLVIENENIDQPIKMYISGNYTHGLQIGRDDKNQKITLNGYVSVCGTLRADEVKVNLNGCDFVFENDYQLKTLKEVEQFINKNKRDYQRLNQRMKWKQIEQI